MAGKGLKRTYEEFKEEALGYLHNVEEVKVSQRNNSKYFCCQLQGESTNHRVICFAPHKHSTFVNAEKLQSPVKLCQIKYSPGKKKNVEILANQTSQLDIIPMPLGFKRKLSLPETSAELKVLKLNAIDDDKTDLDGSYIIKGKVIKVEEEKTVTIFKTQKKMKNIIIHDGTSHIGVILFEGLIEKVHVGKSYTFSNVGIRSFNDCKSMTSKVSTEISEIEEIQLPVDFKLEDEIFKAGTIMSVAIDNFVLCPSCKSQLVNIEPILHDDTQKIVKCQNEMCKMSCRKKELTYSIRALLSIKLQGNVNKMQLPNNVACEFLKSIEKSYLLKDSSALELFLLDEDNVFEFQTNSLKAITNIRLVQAK